MEATATRTHIRWLVRRDLDEVMRIERTSFEFPWKNDDFIRCLRQRNCIGMVAEKDDRVVAFMIYELCKSRIHVLNFAIDEAVRRSGVGRQMVDKLKAKLSAQRRNRIALEVRETNLAALVFFRSLGFRAVQILRHFYADTEEDAYLMNYRLDADSDSSHVNQPPFQTQRSASIMCPTDALEERRKKTTLRKIDRKHAGKIVQPYAIMEKLIAEVAEFAPLKKAKIIIVWKSGWKATKDDILRHAQIRKLTELEREIWGDQFDLCMLLHRELWQSGRFTDEEREMDIFHELLHPVPEIDDKTGEQKKDDKGRRCWRLRNHPIQRFAEEIERYGLDKVLHLDENARTAVDDELSQEGARADENDSQRPLLQKAATKCNASEWRKQPIDKIGLKASHAAKLLEADIRTAGELQNRMQADGTWWNRGVKGIGDAAKESIELIFNQFVIDNESQEGEQAAA